MAPEKAVNNADEDKIVISMHNRSERIYIHIHNYTRGFKALLKLNTCIYRKYELTNTMYATLGVFSLTASSKYGYDIIAPQLEIDGNPSRDVLVNTPALTL